MSKLIPLTRKILFEHFDPDTKSPEIILLGWCSNKTASEHLSRYVFASNFAHGIVLDLATGSCYGSSILMRSNAIQYVISLDIDIDLLLYGKIVYNANCIQADATHLPFRKRLFNTIVSMEALEHIKCQDKFICTIKSSLKKRGHLILSTPNKLFSSPFLPKPLNPYHISEYYFGQILNFLSSHRFTIIDVYGGRNVGRLEIIRRIVGSLVKFLLYQFSLKPHLLDKLYSFLSLKFIKNNDEDLVDPNPNIFLCRKIESSSKIIILYRYFIIHAVKTGI